jgi:hypothetical protein
MRVDVCAPAVWKAEEERMRLTRVRGDRSATEWGGIAYDMIE